MCCLAEFLVKYILIIANIVFALAGIAIIGLGVAVHLQIREIAQLIAVNLTAISIAIIVLGCIVFVIAFLACCGAIRKSRCMLLFYGLFMAILAAGKIYLAVVIFNFLDDVIATVEGWLNSAFRNQDLRPVFNTMEALFSCCGTVGPSVYNGTIPGTCCGNPVDTLCNAPDAFVGCNPRVSSYFESFGSAIGGVLIFVIIVELVCIIFGSFLACQSRNKKRYA